MPKNISFPMPEGFQAPEDSQPGKPFEVMATVMMTEDGMLALSAIDGAPVAAESEESESEGAEMEIEAPEGEGFLVAVEKGMKS